MTERPSMVFHVPQPLEDDPRVGSRGHVSHMLQGFREAGYSVELISGHSKDRALAIRRVRSLVRAGQRFDFVYSEATTIPTALNDPNHLPVRPLMDLRFLGFMRRHGIPVGLFYPDVHWRFDFHRKVVPLAKRVVAGAFYRFDLLCYSIVLDRFFMPSLRMARSVPGWGASDRVEALYPGGHSELLPLKLVAGELRLFYVGSVAPPLYDISELIGAVESVEGVHLTICCPESEGESVRRQLTGDRIRIVHEHGRGLVPHYAESHLACLVYSPSDYRAFAMPMKLFEALGYGRPVIVAGGLQVDEFVAENECGWVVRPEELTAFLALLRDQPALVKERHESVNALLDHHSWVRRAEQVAASLRS